MFELSNSIVVSVPLNCLSAIPNGVRKTNGVSIESLAASIKAEGLLQNLTVVVDPDAPQAAPGSYRSYQVIAGCRRLRALRHLADKGDIEADFMVPCRLVEETQALSASLAENAIREAMHPADEFVAFRELHDQGKPIEDIAARYGVSPLFVRRRLALANVAPKLFEKFRTDEISLAQMTALAIVDDHAAQERAWGKKSAHERTPERLRAALTTKEIDASEDPIARFVGLPEYEAAGGVVHRDLFADGGGYIVDAPLLRDLAQNKLEAIADKVRAESWSFVDVRAARAGGGARKMGPESARQSGRRRHDRPL